MILIFLLTISFIMLGISILALRSNPRSTTNKLFLLFVLTFDIWLLANYFSNSSQNYDTVLLTNKLIFFSTTWLIFFLALFIKSYPNAKVKYNLLPVSLAFIGAIFISILSFTDVIVQYVEIKYGFSDIVFGDGIIIYAVYFLLLLVFSIYTLFRKFHRSQGIERLKIQYLFVGIILTSAGTIITNLIFPIIFNNFELSNIGTGFSIFLVSFTGYSIIKHRLFGIRMLLGSIFTMSIVAIFTFVMFYGVLTFENVIFESPFELESILANVFIAFIFSILFVNIYNYASKVIRRSFIHSAYDPTIELEKFNSLISEKLNFKDVNSVIKQYLSDLFKIKEITLFLNKDNSDSFFSIDEDKKISKEIISKFFNTFNNSGVSQEELESLKFSGKINAIQSNIYTFNYNNNIAVLVPLRDQRELSGFIALGKRGIPYDQIDITFLESIARSINLAVGRAHYFKKFEDLISDLEAKVEERTKQLRELAEEQKNIIDVMGHEIRTPLSVINSEISLHEEITISDLDKWLKKEMSDKDIKNLFDSLKVISKATAQAISLVNDMLETARIDKKRFELNYSKFDLVETVKSSVELMKKTANSSIHTIIFDSKIARLELEADEIRITEALQALISNAIKYGINPDTGKAEITISIELGKSFDEVVITISDKGIGIKKEDIEKLGQKFLRLNPETKNLQRPKGTGLGLFVVKNIMKYHGGKLIISSDGIGKGASFKIILPTKNQK